MQQLCLSKEKDKEEVSFGGSRKQPYIYITDSLTPNNGQLLADAKKIARIGSVVNFHLLKGIYIPNFRKFHQTVWILAIFFIFFPFFASLRPKKARIENRALW